MNLGFSRKNLPLIKLQFLNNKKEYATFIIYHNESTVINPVAESMNENVIMERQI